MEGVILWEHADKKHCSKLKLHKKSQVLRFFYSSDHVHTCDHLMMLSTSEVAYQSVKNKYQMIMECKVLIPKHNGKYWRKSQPRQKVSWPRYEQCGPPKHEEWVKYYDS